VVPEFNSPLYADKNRGGSFIMSKSKVLRKKLGIASHYRTYMGVSNLVCHSLFKKGVIMNSSVYMRTAAADCKKTFEVQLVTINIKMIGYL
jgi:hypothetical protein